MSTATEINYRGLDQAAPTTPMTEDETSVFLSLGLAEMYRPGPPSDEQLALLQQSGFIQIILGRLQAVGVTDWQRVVSPEAVIMLGSLSTSDSPGRAVLWAYTLLYWRVEEQEPLTIELLSQRFSAGFPTVDAIRERWESQKVYNLGIERKGGESDNGLDHASLWQPLVDQLNEQEKASVEDTGVE